MHDRRLLIFANLVTAATLLTVSPSAWASPSVVYPAAGNHIHSSVCPAADGVNVLVPDPVENDNEFFLLTAVSQEMVDELTNGDTPFPGWTYQSTAVDLNGSFFVDVYKSRFRANHWSGSEINARYKRGAGDPPAGDLRWVQLITTTDPIDPGGPGAPPGPPTSPYIDPYPDDADGQGGPFYYSDEADSTFDYRKHVSGAEDHGFGTDYDVHFYDFPNRPHPPTSFTKWTGELWLTKYEPPKNVIFLAGLGYGFEAACINWDDFSSYVLGSDGAGVFYDPSSGVLSFSPVTINVLNRNGNPHGVDPIFRTDPLNHAQMMIQPFHLVEDSGLPLGLSLFKGGAVQVVSGSGLLYSALIPYLVLGDDMNAAYTMTGVYGGIQAPGQGLSPFLSQYEAFRSAGAGGGNLARSPEPPRSTGGNVPDVDGRVRTKTATGETMDRANPGAPEDNGTYRLQNPGHSPQFFVKTGRTVADLLANGGASPASVWNSFGPRDPGKGLILEVDKTRLSWGSLGKAVRYDVVRGDIGILLSTGNFAAATQECLADNTAATSVPYTAVPAPGQGSWFLVRAVRGSIAGTFDTLQPSQQGSRDDGIAASGAGCP